MRWEKTTTNIDDQWGPDSPGPLKDAPSMKNENDVILTRLYFLQEAVIILYQDKDVRVIAYATYLGIDPDNNEKFNAIITTDPKFATYLKKNDHSCSPPISFIRRPIMGALAGGTGGA